jgi:hypothetical protein
MTAIAVAPAAVNFRRPTLCMLAVFLRLVMSAIRIGKDQVGMTCSS